MKPVNCSLESTYTAYHKNPLVQLRGLPLAPLPQQFGAKNS